MAQSALQRQDARIAAVRDLMDELVAMDEPRRHVAGLISGLDVRYDLGEAIRCSGAGCPTSTWSSTGAPCGSTPCSTPPGRCWSTSEARRASPSGRGRTGCGGGGAYTGAWELPVIGAVEAPPAVLLRPDGHVAWVGDGTPSGLEDALITWFGTPAPRV